MVEVFVFPREVFEVFVRLGAWRHRGLRRWRRMVEMEEG